MLSRRDATALMGAGLLTVALPTRGQSAVRARNVVLVHGLFADGSCWLDVIPLLQSEGLKATAVQNPLTTLEAATAEVRRVLAQQDGPTVLVGHSFAGTIITEVGDDPKVASLVYIAARAPDVGENYTALTKRFLPAPASGGIVFDGDVGQLTETAFLRDFASDLPVARARPLWAVQQPFHKALVAARTSRAAWRSRPTFYAISTKDRTIDPDLQRFMAARMNAKTMELPAGHLAMLSYSKDVAAFILRAAG